MDLINEIKFYSGTLDKETYLGEEYLYEMFEKSRAIAAEKAAAKLLELSKLPEVKAKENLVIKLESIADKYTTLAKDLKEMQAKKEKLVNAVKVSKELIREKIKQIKTRAGKKIAKQKVNEKIREEKNKVKEEVKQYATEYHSLMKKNSELLGIGSFRRKVKVMGKMVVTTALIGGLIALLLQAKVDTNTLNSAMQAFTEVAKNGNEAAQRSIELINAVQADKPVSFIAQLLMTGGTAIGAVASAIGLGKEGSRFVNKRKAVEYGIKRSEKKGKKISKKAIKKEERIKEKKRGPIINDKEKAGAEDVEDTRIKLKSKGQIGYKEPIKL
jgi:hypothetical protein